MSALSSGMFEIADLYSLSYLANKKKLHAERLLLPPQLHIGNPSFSERFLNLLLFSVACEYEILLGFLLQILDLRVDNKVHLGSLSAISELQLAAFYCVTLLTQWFFHI